MTTSPPKIVREFIKNVKRASRKDKKSVIMSMKQAREIAVALEGTFTLPHIS